MSSFADLDDKINLTTKMSEVYKAASKVYLINLAEEKVKKELEAARILIEGPPAEEVINSAGTREPQQSEAVNIDIDKGPFDYKPKTANTTTRAGKAKMRQNLPIQNVSASNQATLHKSHTPTRSYNKRNSAISSISANVTNSRKNRAPESNYSKNPYNLDISQRIGQRYNKAVRMSTHVETEADLGKEKSVFDSNKRFNSQNVSRVVSAAPYSSANVTGKRAKGLFTRDKSMINTATVT